MTPLKKIRRLTVGAAALLLVSASTAAAASSPSVVTGSASAIKDASATLHGATNPNGSATSAHFEYGLTASYGQGTPTLNIGAGTHTVKLALNASGLIPGTVYHYRLDAINRYGETLGTDRTFTTTGNPPPDAATGPASAVSQSSAIVSGVINPHGATTSYVFEYGLTSAYTVQTRSDSVPKGASAVTVSKTLDGLAPGTTFHYTVVAYNGSNPVAGTDATFTTEPLVRPYPTLSVLVTPRTISKRPFVIVTSGHVTGPSQFPASDNCAGAVTVHFAIRKRQFASVQTPLGPDCNYSSTYRLGRVPGITRRHRRQTVNVSVTFDGNNYIAPRSTAPKAIRLG